MSFYAALQYAMRTWRTGRIGPGEADRLVGGGTPSPGHEGLSVLLDAAKAPATAGELAGESAAVAGFAAARRGVAPTGSPRGRRHVRVPLVARTVAMKVAAGFVVLTVSGTALAAETGALPATAQRHAHRMFSSLGVPAPTPGSRPLRSGTGAGPSGDPTPRDSPTPSAATSPAPGDVTPPGLCRAWAATRKNPHAKAMTAASRRALAAAAGGEAQVPGYCTALLAATPAAGRPPAERTGKPSTPPGHATPKPSHSGNGGGNGKGNNGKDHPTPGPHN
jgi:hypothetical protein